MPVRLDRVASRSVLSPRHEPYWQRIRSGCYVGYRRISTSSTGAWLARYRDGATGERKVRSLGSLDERPEYERFDAACGLANDWFVHMACGGSSKISTVNVACAAYVRHLREERREDAASDAEARFRRWIENDPLGPIELQRLGISHVRAWRKRLAATEAIPQDKKSRLPRRPRADATINRDMASLRAALNFAKEERAVLTDQAWSQALKPIRGADRRRDGYLSAEQRRSLLEAASLLSPEISDFLRALSLVPLRPGAMASLVVSNFDEQSRVLSVCVDKAGAHRKIKLPASTSTFFSRLAAGKDRTEPLLSRPDGKAWDSYMWKKPVKAAVLSAGLPSTTTAYTLRHSVITDLIANGIDVVTAARLAGTSVQMVEKHYGHLVDHRSADALERLQL